MERLQKFLARAGVASRRAAEELMRQGRVTVNGTVASRPGTTIDPETDSVKVDGRRIVASAASRSYFILNKPRGYVTTVSDPQDRPTVMDLVPKVRGRLFPVGRLDFQTEGLLLLTDDGELAGKLMHPSGKVPKIYRAKVKGSPRREVLDRIRQGMILEGRRTRPAKIRIVRKGENNAWVEVTVTEGRKHLIRKMLQGIGHPVLKLKRTGYGSLTLQGLAVGECRRLHPAEIDALRAGIAPAGRSGRRVRKRSDRS
jgi:pseudouridine synthase